MRELPHSFLLSPAGLRAAVLCSAVARLCLLHSCEGCSPPRLKLPGHLSLACPWQRISMLILIACTALFVPQGAGVQQQTHGVPRLSRLALHGPGGGMVPPEAAGKGIRTSACHHRPLPRLCVPPWLANFGRGWRVPLQIAPTGMIFIPCRNGWSHRPDEHASPEDIARGVKVWRAATLRCASMRSSSRNYTYPTLICIVCRCWR